MPERRATIHSYRLFGESAQLADVMHCEAIDERSARYGWELAPHRHGDLHQILLVRSGGGVARLEERACALGPLSLVNVPPGDVHGFSFEPGTEGHVATLTREMLDEILSSAPQLRRVLSQAFVIVADETMYLLVAQIWREYVGHAAARALVLRGLCATLLGCVARAVSQDAGAGLDPPSSDLLHRFEKLLETHFPEHWKVGDYARALAVTPTHLSRVTRALAGASASRMIDARVMREARRNLAYTDQSVTTIAYALGYSDPAYFSRVFARSAGVPPRDFRKRLTTHSAS